MKEQKFTSAKTAVNGPNGKIPALFTMLIDGTCTDILKGCDYRKHVFDYGCGKIIQPVYEFLIDYRVEYDGYDKYNRTPVENKVFYDFLNYYADDKHTQRVFTCSNTLNVIMEPEHRRELIERVYNDMKAGEFFVVTVHSGNGSGIGRQTGTDQWQNNRKLKDYEGEITAIGFSPYRIRAKYMIFTK